MAGFLDWFFAFLTTMIDGVWKIISGFFGGLLQIFNVVDYFDQFKNYKNGFSVVDWILAIFSLLLVIAIWGILIYLAVLGIRKYIRFSKSAIGSEELLEEVATLHRDVLKLTKERERLLGLKIGQTDVSIKDLDEILEDDGEDHESDNGDILPRFYKLDSIDQKFLTYTAPEYRQDFTLEDLCRDFRNFACSRMGLYYDEKVIPAKISLLQDCIQIVGMTVNIGCHKKPLSGLGRQVQDIYQVYHVSLPQYERLCR
jgi:hypothetical protein